MSVADGSIVRLAYIAEATINTTPTSPAFQVLRYETSDIRISKTTDIPNEVRADGNVASIVDVGRAVTGSINGLLSYGTYDDLIAAALRSTWSTDVLVNGVTHKTFAFEEFYEQGATDTFIRYNGVRINTWDLEMTARQSVKSNFGIMGIKSPTPTSTILSGATYTAATTTEVLNAGLNVSALALTGISNSPKIQKMTMRFNSNIYQNDIVGAYEPYSHGLGRAEVTGTISAYFENVDTYNAILNHTTVAIGWTLADAAGNSYAFSIPQAKLLDGGPSKPGNGKAVMVEVPYQAQFDSGIGASIQITRDPA